MSNFNKNDMDFLKNEIKEYCNSDGYYEAYYDYNDQISDADLEDALKNYEKDDFDYPDDYLVSRYFDASYTDSDEEYFINQIANDYEEKYPDKENITLNDDFNEMLYEAGYNGVDLQIDKILKQTPIYVDIDFATKNEMNGDMGSIMESYSNYLYDDKDKEISMFDNALTYLIHQQGHTVKEVFDDYHNNPKGYNDSQLSFIKSVTNELANNDEYSQSALTALVKLDGEEYLNLISSLDKNKDGYIKLSKEAKIGLYNSTQGAGSLFEINPEKDIIIPTSMINSIINDNYHPKYFYSVGDSYGLTADCWKEDVISFTKEKPKLMEENMDKLVKEINKNDDKEMSL